jgi:hypothetical protein
MTIDDLMQQIEETERLIAVYRNANEVIVGTQDEIYSRRGLINRTPSRRPRLATRSSASSSADLRQCEQSSRSLASNIKGEAADRAGPVGRVPRRIAFSAPRVPPLWLHRRHWDIHRTSPPNGYAVHAYRPEAR